MRMWLVEPRTMCRQHLLGEHLEMHMFNSCIEGGRNLSGYIDHGLVMPHYIHLRHDDLAVEMLARGYNHTTPIKFLNPRIEGNVDGLANKQILRDRCEECRKLQDQYEKEDL